MFDRFSTAARQAVINSQDVAKADATPVITPLHLLIGCLNTNNTLKETFAQYNITEQSATVAVDEYLELQRLARTHNVPEMLKFDKETKKTLEGALRIALQEPIGSQVVEPWMLAVASLSVDDLIVSLDLSNNEAAALKSAFQPEAIQQPRKRQNQKDQTTRQKIRQLADAIEVMKGQMKELQQSLSDGGQSGRMA